MKNPILETLETIDGGRSTFATLVLETTPKMRKTNNPFYGRVKKVQVVNVRLNTNYENAVNNQRQREGEQRNFTAAGNWHEKLADKDNGCISCKKSDHSALYLNYIEEKKLQTVYLLDGLPATEKELQAIFAFFPKYDKKKIAEAQGTQKPIIFRLVAIDNIKRLTVNKQTVTA